MTPPVLEILSVAKQYGGLRPLRIERLTIAAGELVALTGVDQPAAEMLTTLVSGASLPDAGTVALFGHRTDTIRDSREWLVYIDRIAIVSERAALLESLTVIQNLAMPFTLEVEPPPEEVTRAACALATEAAVPEAYWGQPVSTLDRAALLRVRLARALALSPELLLLEHPTAYLDQPLAKAFVSDLRSIARSRGLATVLMTMDADLAAASASRVLKWEPATGRFHEQRFSLWPFRFR